MTPLRADEIRGVWTTPLLRVEADGRLDLSCLEEQIAAYAEARVDGVYTNGTAAEFHGQSDAEFREISTRVASLCVDRGLAFQIGATHPLPQATLERIRFARRLAPAAIQVILPDWAPINLSAARRFLLRCAEESGEIGLVLYNPPHAKTVLSPADFAALAETVPGLCGIKCGGGDADWYAAMAPILDRLSVFIPGHHMASGMLNGAAGSYSNMACLHPGATVAWRDRIATSPDDALALEHRVGRFMDKAIGPILAAGHPGYACDKFMAFVGGWTRITPRLMWPAEGVPEQLAPRVRRWAKELIPEFLGSVDT